MLDGLLDQVVAEGWSLNPPATAEGIAAVERWFQSQVGIDLPDGYGSLLKRTDGLDFNGAVIYASADSTEQVFIPGIAESNARLNEDLETSQRYVGETGSDLYAVEAGGTRWSIVDRVSRDVDETFASSEEMLAAVLRKYLDM